MVRGATGSVTSCMISPNTSPTSASRSARPCASRLVSQQPRETATGSRLSIGSSESGGPAAWLRGGLAAAAAGPDRRDVEDGGPPAGEDICASANIIETCERRNARLWEG